MRRYIWDLAILGLFVIITVFTFRQFVFNGQIPFPANLLISVYEPWKSYPLPGYPNGPANKPIGFDNLRQFYPQRTIINESIKQMQVPLWNPYVFTGNTLIGTYISAVFHPLAWLYLLLPQITSYSVIILLEPLIASVFMYLYLRSLKLTRVISCFGALTYSLSGFFIVWWEEAYTVGYSAMALPLALFAVEKYTGKIKTPYIILFVLSLLFSILSGSFQMTFYVLGFVLIYIIYKKWLNQIKAKDIIFFIAAMVLAFVLAGVHLAPSVDSYLNSARGSTDAKYLFDGYLLPVSNLITFIAPDFFGSPAVYNYYGRGFYHERMMYFGVIPFFLMIYAVLTIGWKNKKSFWIYAFLFFLSLGMALPTSWFLLYTLKLPFLSVIIPSRILYLSVFSGSVLAAYGLTGLSNRPKKKQLIFLSGVMLFILAAITAYLGLEYLKIYSPIHLKLQIRNLALPVIEMLLLGGTAWLAFYKPNLRKYALYFIVAISVSGSLYLANKYLYFSFPNLLFPDVPVIAKLQDIAGLSRVWTFGEGRIDNNLISQYGLYSPEGYESFFIKRYGDLVSAAENKGKLKQNISRSDVLLKSESRVDMILNNFYRKRLLQLLGVKYIAGLNRQPKDVTTPVITPKELEPVWQDGKYIVYRYRDAFPRAFITGDVITGNRDQQILDDIYNPDINLLKTVILEGYNGSGGGGKGTAQIVSYQPNEVKIRTITDSNGFLVLTDSYFPGWTAKVDGKIVPVYRADYAFRAVQVPAGKHQVVFKFEPLSWKIGLISSGSGLLLLLAISAVYLMRKKPL